MTCGECRFCDTQKWECHRYPPIKEYQTDNGLWFPRWISVGSEFWCGEFKCKDGTKPVPIQMPSDGDFKKWE